MPEIIAQMSFNQLPVNMITLSDETGSWNRNNPKAPENDLVSHVIRNHGHWETYQTEITLELLKSLKNRKMIDVGAHLGYYTLMAGCFGWEVEAIERFPLFYDILERNVINNGFSPLINCLKASVGPNYTLDNLIKDRPIGLIKIDVEGQEPQIIKGAQRSLSKGLIEALIIEISPKFKPLPVWIELINTVKSYGYETYDLGTSPTRYLNRESQHLKQLKPFDIELLAKLHQTNLLFIKK